MRGDDGQTTVDLLASLSMMLTTQPDQITLENVANEELKKLVYSFLQEMYELDRIVLSPDMFGHPVRRVSFFMFARHKWKTMPWKHSIALPDFVDMFKHLLVASWRAFLVAALEEKETEHEWTVSRPSVLPFLTNIEHEGRFHAYLTPTEKEILDCYRSSSPAGTCFSLNQDVRNGRGRRSGVQLLHTVVKHVVLFGALTMTFQHTADG